MRQHTGLVEARELNWFRIDLEQFSRLYVGFLEASRALRAAECALAMCKRHECRHEPVRKRDGTPDMRKNCPGEAAARELVLLAKTELRLRHHGDLFNAIGLTALVEK